jgi:hypothetical protein
MTYSCSGSRFKRALLAFDDNGLALTANEIMPTSTGSFRPIADVVSPNAH